MIDSSMPPRAVQRRRLLNFLRGDLSEQNGTLFHLEIEDGEVVGVEEQYRP